MNMIKRKIRSSLGNIMRVKSCLTTKAMLILYNSLLLGHLRQWFSKFFACGPLLLLQNNSGPQQFSKQKYYKKQIQNSYSSTTYIVS